MANKEMWIGISGVVLGLILIVAAIAVWIGQQKTEWYFWLLLGLGIVLFIVGFALWIWGHKKKQDAKVSKNNDNYPQHTVYNQQYF